MAVYVDMLINYGWILRGKETPSCHMFADSVEELNDMAKKIGMKLDWFQGGNDQQMPHYDLTASKREHAIRLGAIPCDRRKTSEYLNKWRVSIGKQPI